MLLLYVLFGTNFLVLLASRIITGEWKTRIAGRAGLSALLILTGVGHFLYPVGMTMMFPAYIPLKLELVYFTGVLEIAAAITLMIPKLQRATTWFIIIFFVLVLPCNIYAAMNHVDFQKANFEGEGIDYLWFRIPMQILLIIWAYVFGVYLDRKKYYQHTVEA